MIHNSKLPSLAEMSLYSDFDNPYPSPTLHYKSTFPFTKIPSEVQASSSKNPSIIINTPNMSCREMWINEHMGTVGAQPVAHAYNVSPFVSTKPQLSAMASTLMTPPSSSDLHKHQKHSFSGPVQTGSADPQLFSHEPATSPPASPLFSPRQVRLPSLDEIGLRHFVHEHANADWNYKHTERPTEAEYMLVLDVLQRMQQRQSPEYKERSRSLSVSPRKLVTGSVATASRRGVANAKLSSPAGARAKPTTSRVRRASSTQPASGSKRAARAISQAPNGENKSSRAKSTKPTTETDWTKVPDYSADPSTMKDPMMHAKNEHIVKSFGGGTLIDNDPDRHLLSEAEAFVAAKLSLTCDKYILSKRLILQGFVKYLQNRGQSNENWNKTAAQKCCNIDVSKTSAMWGFYNAVGWFDDDMHEHYMRRYDELH